MKKNFTTNLFFIFLAFVSFFVSYQPLYGSSKELHLSEEEYIQMLTETINVIKNNFVDTDKINIEKLYFGAIEGALQSLSDPYTRFLPPEKHEDLKMKTTSKFGGLGIVISKRNKILTVVSPILGTPAFRMGIKPGDQIVEIEGEATDDITLQDAVDKMRGEPGTKVTISIFRPEFKSPKKYTIIRDIIKIDTIQSKVLSNNIGYVRLLEFSETSFNDFINALKELKTQGVKKIIFDLRNNPGGLLDSAYDIANIFLEKGMVVFTRGRHSYQSKNYYANPSATDIINMPLIVLANGGSASGSEIVIGAVKDNNRGLIVGEKTFGKGLVQSVFPFRSLPARNASIAVTTAKYYTPSGVCIQDTGIYPDIEIKPKKLTEDEAESLLKFMEKDCALNFVKKNKEYTDKDIDQLLVDLKKDGIILSRELVEAQIKEQVLREDGKHYFGDPKTDEVLRRAIDLFTSYDILKQTFNGKDGK